MKSTLNTIRKRVKQPVAVGFGISNAREAKTVAKLADGVIIGSAIVKLIHQKKSIINFVKEIRTAV